MKKKPMNVPGWCVLPAVPVFDDFVQNSRFGCPDCYGVFDLFINDKIKQLQGSESHRGKQPKYQRAQETISENNEEMVPADVLQKAGENAAKEQPEGMKEITQLERRLKEALEKEDYETAAACRDQIRALKAGKGGEVHE